MALSRTARILIAVLLLAAAGFFWLNFFQQNATVEAPAGPTPTPAATPSTAAPLSGGAGPLGTSNGIITTPEETPMADGVPSTDSTAPAGQAVAPEDAPDAAPSEAAVVTPAEQTPTPVVVTDPPAVVLRDLVVDPLPFLVTEPPVADLEQDEEDTEASGRPVTAARANVNPFSPIVVQAPPAAAQQPVASVPVDSTPTTPEVVIVEGGPEPTGAPTANGVGTTTVARAPVAAPAPRAVAPASTRTGELPRPLPAGTLSAVPDILRDARTQPTATAGPANLGTVAAVVVPGDADAASLPYAASSGTEPAATTPEPIGPGHVQQAEQLTSPTLAVAIGADPLSRYLRDNNVRFTGQVLGPLSVGVFRSNLYQQPAVVMLGQTLPDSEILLSDLRGYEARFTLGQNTQVLSLDTRR